MMLGENNSDVVRQPQPARGPGGRWVALWILLSTLAIPAALIAMAPLTVFFTWIAAMGSKAGLWPASGGSALLPIGFVAAIALLMPAAQWALLRRYLPRAWGWFAATSLGFLLGSLAAGLVVAWLNSLNVSWAAVLGTAALLLPLGLIVGLAQWLFLRRLLPNAGWIIPIDGLAAASIALAGQSINSLIELLVIILLPGLISGVGLWLLLRQSPPLVVPRPEPAALPAVSRISRPVRVMLALAAVVPLFFACIWVYAVSHLALAKSNGVYPSVEEAVIGHNSRPWGGAQVVRVADIRTGPNRGGGAQPHVWFGTATVYMDRVPQGYNRDQYTAGSYYLRVREGWVLVPEGTFPEFIGWVMELYGLEGVPRR